MNDNRIDNSESSLYEILKNCVNLQSYESLPIEDYNDYVGAPSSHICDYYKMISTNLYSASGNISCSSYASDDSFSDNILEDDGRISLAYESLTTIPRKIAEKFASQTKFLDLTYNNFQSLSFLTFFEDLHTLILDRNYNLDVNTLPYLPNLSIMWINNCNISNITDWIHRIRNQCPVIKQLSVMGNPGINHTFTYCPVDSPAITSIVGDYREYILKMLPSLEYLDSTPCIHGSSSTIDSSSLSSHNNDSKLPSSQSSIGNTSMLNGRRRRASDCIKTSNNSRKSSLSPSFKDIFSLMRRKNSGQSSYTN